VTSELVAEAASLRHGWDDATPSLRSSSIDEQLKMLRAFAELADSYLGLVLSARTLWDEVEQLGGVADGVKEVTAAGRLFTQVRYQVGRALDARLKPWSPKDPERFERGLREAQEGKAIRAEDLIEYYRERSRGSQ
jgi:hypothetical protein